ncbi:glycosyltransferase [Paenibacillus sp. KQZ6P-2]|uniref:Glycosyltransferase n=1 Tax=Paenibacillus mangrovi TaxID=2931978 RepID=A0A9X2B5I9_9BACL|nr:glycosyltransferase family 2 protein [Paenibacillus mangrovi]MCJ8012752.1 glycosyltransferase [Paenibacillus mangrovi]
MKISVCMIVKNEAEQIARALASVPPSYELIVVDTGSTDETVKIASEYKAKVYYFEWNDSFSDARNWAIEKASGDYILFIDADEKLSPNVVRQIDDFVSNFPSEAGAVKISNVINDEVNMSRMIRFFPNRPEFRFYGEVHEHLRKNNQEIQMIKCDIEIEHFGYNPETYLKMGKFNRYIKMYKRIIEKDPNNGYMLYQLGKLYYSNKQFENAYEAFEECLCLEQFDRLYFAPMLVQLGYTLKELGKSQQAIELLELFVPMYPKFPDLPFVLGILAIECGKFQLIEKYFKFALEIGETDHYSTLIGSGSYRAAHNLGVYYEVTGNLVVAKKYYQLAAGHGFGPSNNRLTELINNTK